MGKKIGFIGAGNMATAIIGGLISKNISKPKDIYIFDLSQEKLDIMKNKGISTVHTSSEVVISSDIIVLAVKPQNYVEVLQGIKEAVTEDKVFVTIAAGISTAFVNNQLEKACPMVRVMPNTPMLLGKGATAICRNDIISDDDFNFVKQMFELGGTVEILREEDMNKIISVNGSSPAYIYMFAKAMVEYAVENGIAKDTALNLICATLEGSAAMLRTSDDDIDTLIEKVCSKGGTTIEAVNTLNEYNFCEGIKKAMESCTKRAEELGK